MIAHWKRLLKRLGINQLPSPSGYEIFNGTIIFWFDTPEEIRRVLHTFREKGINYSIEWDREEGLTGVALKRELLSE